MPNTNHRFISLIFFSHSYFYWIQNQDTVSLTSLTNCMEKKFVRGAIIGSAVTLTVGLLALGVRYVNRYKRFCDKISAEVERRETEGRNPIIDGYEILYECGATGIDGKVNLGYAICKRTSQIVNKLAPDEIYFLMRIDHKAKDRMYGFGSSSTLRGVVRGYVISGGHCPH